MASVAELLAMSVDLSGEGARRDAEILLCHCLNKSRAWLYTWPDSEIDSVPAGEFIALLAARREGHPVAHLTGRREFWSLNLRVNEHTLIPRPETETLVEWAIALDLAEDASVLDLGTGSGAIALALAQERPAWNITGLDASINALEVARANAGEYGLDRVCFLGSNWFEQVDGRCFDLLVSNPPYVEEGDVHLSRGDLRFEPLSALVAPGQGLADLTTLVESSPHHLGGGGWLLLEHGHNQGEQLRFLLRERGFANIETRRDLAGLERISGGQWHA